MPGFAGGTPPPPPPAPLLVDRGPGLDASFLPVLVRPSTEETRDSKTLTAAVEALRSGGHRRASILLEDYRRHSVGTLRIRCLHGWALALSGELDVARNMATALVAGEDPAAPGPAYLMGVVLDEQGRQGDAFAWYQIALRAAPSDADLLTRTAATGSAAREPEFVLECLEKLDRGGGLPLELEPLRARALAQVGRGEAALLTYDLLLGQLGEKPDFLAEAGLCAFGLGRERNDPSFFDLAADYFNRSVEVDPQNARASYNLGCALDWADDSSGAELSYFRALEVRPDYLEAAENLSELFVRNDRPGEALEILNEQLRQPLPEASRLRLLARLASLEETSREEG